MRQHTADVLAHEFAAAQPESEHDSSPAKNSSYIGSLVHCILNTQDQVQNGL